MAKRMLKTDLEKRVAELEAMVRKLSAEPGIVNHYGTRYASRPMPEDGNIRIPIENFASNMTGHIDEYERDNWTLYVIEDFYNELPPNVDGVIVEYMYDDDCGFMINRVWPCQKIA